MKTTVEVPDSLFREAKAYAARNGMPVREVFELGLRMVLEGSAVGRSRFRLKTVTTKDRGLGRQRRLDCNSIAHLRRPRRMIALGTNILVYSVREDFALAGGCFSMCEAGGGGVPAGHCMAMHS